jgi:hypothetical protein
MPLHTAGAKNLGEDEHTQRPFVFELDEGLLESFSRSMRAVAKRFTKLGALVRLTFIYYSYHTHSSGFQSRFTFLSSKSALAGPTSMMVPQSTFSPSAPSPSIY